MRARRPWSHAAFAPRGALRGDPPNASSSHVRRSELTVKRIVSNVPTSAVDAAHGFYHDLLGLDLVMDLGWIRTYGSSMRMTVQVSFASEGGSGTPVPDLSIEVDDFDDVHRRMTDAGIALEYGPVREPWGVRRFYVRDPFGRLLNILSHD